MSILIEEYERRLLDNITEPTLNSNLLSIRGAVDNLWADGPLVRDYTDHGLEHCIRLMRHLFKLQACNQEKALTQEEMYVLIASAYLHDVGMQADVVQCPDLIAQAEVMGAQFEVDFDAPTTSQYSTEEQAAIRENHHWLSGAWLKHAKDSSDDTSLSRAVRSIPPRALDAIIEVVIYHSTRDINNCGDKFFWMGKQRQRLLAALLRLADEMDIASDRVKIDTVKEHRLSPDNALWWWLHYYTELDLDERGVLTVQVAVNEQDYADCADKVKQLVIDHFADKNYQLIDLLFKSGIHIHSDLESNVAPSLSIDSLPLEIKEEIDKRLGPSENAWTWLCRHEPESYKQLQEKLEEHRVSLALSGQTELRQLIEVFEWCKDQGIELAELQIPGNLHKYRQAVVKMSRIVRRAEPENKKVEDMRAIIERVKSDPNRDATREWARAFKGQKANGCQFDLAGESTGFVVIGPNMRVRRIREEVDRLIDWNLLIDDVLIEIQRGVQAANGK